MKPIGVRSNVTSLVIAVVLLLPVSPILAGAPDAQLAMTQGSRSPFSPVPAAERAGDRHRGPIEVTFTKWITTYPLMAGFTGGDVPGDFVGEVLQRQVSQDGRVIRLEAVYEIQSGKRSFTALIRGGTNGDTGAALLDGVILGGWRTGAAVHVAFQTKTNCLGAPDAGTCFEGTISISRDSED
jgi:hypothetical protein